MDFMIKANLPNDNTDLEVMFDGNTHLLTNLEDQLHVQCDEDKVFAIMINQPLTNQPSLLVEGLLFPFTCLFQGVFHVIFFHNDADWFEAIHPYRLHAKLKVKAVEKELVFTYRNSKYNDTNKCWEKPVFHCETTCEMEIAYIPNDTAFISAFVKYVKGTISSMIVCSILFLVLLYVSIDLDHQFALILLIGIIAFICFICIWTVISNFKKYKTLKQLFSAQVIKEERSIKIQ